MPVASDHRCWICASKKLRVAQRSRLEDALDAKSFAITDSHYGRTAELHRCDDCGFRQCSDLGDVVHFYEELEDPHYEATRDPRALQMRGLLDRILAAAPRRAGARVLDVGAGSGILVEEARALGLDARGVEPSRWFVARARERGLPVEEGTLPHPAIQGPFDLVLLVDVIEHVSDPVGLLEESRRVLARDGVVAVVTPDMASLPARLLGARHWHCRVAHVGYFTRETLDLALARTGLERFHISRPSWVFELGYLLERVGAYLPGRLRLPVPRPASRIRVKLNLRDSYLVLARTAQTR
jgi:2-polyprenyl-3-methyl-5-hydroxy-6-metoxy-1,4-benzoquinol methylase